MVKSIDAYLHTLGAVGRRLEAMDAIEGGAGNISLALAEAPAGRERFSFSRPVELPGEYPHLAGCWLLATGSGTRLREIGTRPDAVLGLLHVGAGGASGDLHTAPDCEFSRLTSELNTHLAVHDLAFEHGAGFQALIHAQPPYLTLLSHIERYQQPDFFNRRVLRWQPESIFQFPQGIAVLPFCNPGSKDLETATRAAFAVHSLALWGKHGVMAASQKSATHALDRIEYAEAGARYEYLNLAAGEPATGLTPQEIVGICAAFGVDQQIFTLGDE